MLIGVLFACLAIACGLAARRWWTLPLSLTPLVGLALLAVVTTWLTALGAPPLAISVVVLGLAVLGAAQARPSVAWATVASVVKTGATRRWAVLVLASSVLVPMLILGLAFASVEAPISTHDGSFHVETIDSLRRGTAVQGWYPMGFH